MEMHRCNLRLESGSAEWNGTGVCPQWWVGMSKFIHSAREDSVWNTDWNRSIDLTQFTRSPKMWGSRNCFQGMVIRSHRQVEYVVFCKIKSFCRKMKSGFVCMCQRILSANFACFLEKQMQIVPRLALGYSVSLPDRYDATDFRTHPVLQWKQGRRNSRYIIPTNHSRTDALIR